MSGFPTIPEKYLEASLNTNNGIYSYGTEKAVGQGVRKSGVPRKDIFITTKLWSNKHHPDDVASALQQSLDDLGMDYVDLYLMHWPMAWKRGEDPFPKQNGKPVMEDIDFVDVCSTSTSYIPLLLFHA